MCVQQLCTVSIPINASLANASPVSAAVATDPPDPDNSSYSASSSPAFGLMSSTPFRWGDVMSQSLCKDIGKAYEKQTLWRKNTFSPPSAHAGTEFVKEHTRLLRAYKNRTPMERVALQAIMVMPSLLLQRPHAKASSKVFTRFLSLWKAGKIKELLEEARTIQS